MLLERIAYDERPAKLQPNLALRASRQALNWQGSGVMRAPLPVVWTTSLEDWYSPQFQSSLSDDEMQRADRYRDADDRLRFITGRTLLRQALSHVVDQAIAPYAWSFEIGASGKPRLTRKFQDLEFSISHDAGCVAVAVSHGAPVGIDVQKLDRDVEIIDDVLTDRERIWLAGLSPAMRAEAFIRIWTLKEATAKALGRDMSPQRLEARIAPATVTDLGDRAQAFHCATEIISYAGSYSLSAAVLG